jgi:HSP20 family protein
MVLSLLALGCADARSFTLSNKVDQEKISANLEDGVLTLTLPKAKHAQPRKIAIG